MQTKEDGAAIEASLVFLLVLFKACWSFLVFSALQTPEDTACHQATLMSATSSHVSLYLYLNC